MSEQTEHKAIDASLTSGEVAEILGLHEMTIRRMAKRGDFPNAFATDGGHIRIPRGDVEAYKAARRVVPPAEGGAA